jgi:hypothetical protein
MKLQKTLPILKTFMKRLKFPTYGCDMYFSDWFLSSLLKRVNQDLDKATLKIKQIKGRLDLIDDMLDKHRIIKGKAIKSL